MTADELEDMMHALLLGVQDVLMSGENLDDEVQLALAATLSNMSTRLDELRLEESQRGPEPEGPAPSEEIQLLWVLAGQQQQAFISYLREYPSPSTRDLLENPTKLAQVLEYLSYHNPPSPKVPIDGIPHADLNSSNVWGSRYNPKNSQMVVRFQNGAEYKYFNISPNIYAIFSKGNASAKTKGKNQWGEWWPGKNPSLGAALHQFIKQAGYPYQKIR